MILDESYVENKETLVTLRDLVICSICSKVLIDPQQCLECENSFCFKCLNKWRLDQINFCPSGCENPDYKESSRILRMMLEKLNFKCYNNCSKIIPYSDLIKHENECTEYALLCEECGQIRKRHKFKYQIENKIKLIQKEIIEVTEKIEMLEKENQGIKEENNYIKANLKKFESNKSLEDDNNLFHYESYDTAKNKNFEYEIFRTGCHHYRYHNFVCIFSCCNKAFPCFICHDNESDHSYSDVDKGYCSKCLSIFTWEKTYYCPNCGQFKQKTENLFIEY